MDLTTALAAGLVSGLALAVPLGAIGVLLLGEGAARGWRRGAPAALAVAAVDVLYAVAAVVVGTAAAVVVGGWAPWPRVIGGAVLVVLAAAGLVGASRRRKGAAPERASAGHVPSWRRFLLFLGLTAVNPATLVYFAAVVTAVPGVGASTDTAATFVVGVGCASAAWQLLLVAAGALLHGRGGAGVQRLTAVLGHGAVGVLGVVMVARALL